MQQHAVYRLCKLNKIATPKVSNRHPAIVSNR